MKIDVAYFPSVEGSMTSDDGHTFMLQVKRPTGGDLLLGFPHTMIPNIIEHAAIQSARGPKSADDLSRKTSAAFKATGFQIGRGDNGEVILILAIGSAGQLSFIMADDMPGQMTEVLQKLAN